ncbi:MAG TPA: AMP-binding protein [Acidimicrobiales bacterium]|nr:AMP-binding protein [Acidimicrobiales bacterium]
MADRLPDQLRLMASAYPDKVAYRNLGDGSSLTFLQWERESNRLARGLQARGVGKGDLVAILLEAERILDFIVTYSAVHKLGAVTVPMNNRLSPPEVRAILEHAEVTAIVTSGAYDQAVAPLLGALRSLTTVATVSESRVEGLVDIEDLKSPDGGEIQVPVDDDDLADVMYTSGTTGRPKGVAVRHGNVAMLPNAEPAWQGTGWLSATPVFTFAGLGFIYNPMKAGMTMLYLPKFDAGRWFEIVERERPLMAFVVPAMARLLIHHPGFESADLSSLRGLILGSAPLAPDTLLRLQARLPGAAVLNSYGMTEGGHATFSMDPEGSRARPGAVGRPRPPTEVQIVGDDGTSCPTGEVGEVTTRNPNGHREYYKDPEATARMWEGGWLHTGDLGYLDADGYLYIVGRKKEMIVRGGMNVYADDVEAALQAHPAVIEAAVVGISHDVLGEDVAAFVVIRPGDELSSEELQGFVGERLADYKVPRRITFLDGLPRNAGGKVVKAQLTAAANRPIRQG